MRRRLALLLLAVKTGKGSGAKECGWPLENGKAKETNSPLQLPEGNAALPTP